MESLKEIYRKEGMFAVLVTDSKKTIYREAVRGVILRGQKLLMIHSAVNGDYKFPGGGVETAETHEETLRREILEEVGAHLLEFGDGLGKIVEYDIPKETVYEIFKMTSHYYLCSVDGQFGQQSLDTYEEEFGFRPVWVHIEDAIKTNKSLLPLTQKPEWLAREIFMLEYLQRTLF